MILVTGANSLLGTNVIVELLKRKIDVRAIVRKSNTIVDRTEVVIGDVNSDSDLRRAMQGCTAVIHIAAITAQDLLDLDDYRFNWDCAARVAAMANEMGVDRMIFVSSANTVGNGTAARHANESEPLRPPYSKSLYTQSKVRAEAAVLAAFSGAIIINPGFMLGPYDSKPSSGEIIKRARGYRLVVATTGGKSFVHVRDVAEAIANALEMGTSGERYLATGREMSVKDFYRLMVSVTGQRSRIITLPAWLIVVVGYFGDFLRFCRLRTPLSSTNMKILCQREYYDNSRIVAELKMPQSSVEQSIADAIEWFDTNVK